MHISTARDGMSAPNPRPHADYIDPADFPREWLSRALTIDVEAKAKEDAIVALRAAIMTVPHSERATSRRSASKRLAH